METEIKELGLHEVIFIELQNIRMIHWNAVGDNFDALHSHTDEIIEQLTSDYDDIVELSIANGIRIVNPLLINGITINGQATNLLLNKDEFSCHEGYLYLRNSLMSVLDAVNEITKKIGDQSGSHQGFKTKLDSMSEWLTKEVDFKLARLLKNSEVI